MRSSSPIRFIALIEASKGAIVLLAGTGLLALLHHDLNAAAVSLVAHAHLNPASKYPGIFLAAARQIDDPRLLQLAAGAAAYSVLRFVEAYGLFRERRWAEVLAAGSGAIYLPFELVEIHDHPGALSIVLMLVNAAVVAVMLHALVQRRRAGHGTPGLR